MKVFSDRNFYNLPTNENVCTTCEFHKNRKKAKISEIIYGMSSYWDEFLRLQMGILGVLDVFCNVLNALRPLDPNLKYSQFSRFFDF